MKIVHLHDKPFAMPVADEPAEVRPVGEGGGIEVYLSCVARELLRRGHRLVEMRFSEGDADCTAPAMPHRHRARSSSIVPRRAALQDVEDALQREAPDLIHFHSPYFAVHPMLIARICRRWPTVLTQHDVTPFCLNGTRLRSDDRLCQTGISLGCLVGGCFRTRSRAGLVQDLLRVAFSPAKLRAMRQVPVIAVPSRYLRDQALRHGLAASQLRVLPQFSEFPVTEAAVPDARRILFVGRLVPEKGIGTLLEAFALMRVSGWEATVVGDGPLGEALRDRAAGLPGRIRFLGAVPRRDLPGLFAWTNIVVVPSLIPESFGLVGVEAMAFGRPVVAFPSGGITEWLSDGDTGLMARHADATDLARHLDRLLMDRAMQDAMGRRARLQAAARFGVASHVDQLERLYGEACRLFRAPQATASNGSLAA